MLYLLSSKTRILQYRIYKVHLHSLGYGYWLRKSKLFCTSPYHRAGHEICAIQFCLYYYLQFVSFCDLGKIEIHIFFWKKLFFQETFYFHQQRVAWQLSPIGGSYKAWQGSHLHHSGSWSALVSWEEKSQKDVSGANMEKPRLQHKHYT